ncbi:MAG: sulfate/molybdate ABC transporter ATP-binding protein [Leucobacter sp.]
MSANTGMNTSTGIDTGTVFLEANILVQRGGAGEGTDSSDSALRVDVRFQLADGEVLAIMGPSGAGKSTVLDAISGLLRLDSGRIDLGGTSVADTKNQVHIAPSRRSIGVLGQETLLFPHMTAAENVSFAARASGHSAAEARTVANEWLHRVSLGDFADRAPSQLSGGQQQRVALARALAARPKLLLLDEPFVALDVEAAAHAHALLREQLASSGTAAIIVSHDGFDAIEVADRLLILEAGVITQEGPVREVLTNPQTSFVSAVARRVVQ